MGLINKLKNVLFEETEIEEPEKEEIVEQKIEDNIESAKMSLPKINRESKKKEENVKKEEVKEYNFEDESDHELFKIDKTFNFPDFDEDEFEDFIPKKKEEPKKEPVKQEKEYNSRIHKEDKQRREFSSTRVIKTLKDEEPKKIFRPSPVISPVYGILDKNYKKEDILTRDEKNEKDNVKLDVDSVRKKAFGTLEEDLANTTDDEPIINFYGDNQEELEEETINAEENIVNDLLESAVDNEIDVTKEMEISSKEEFGNEIEDELESSDEIDEIFADTKNKIDEEEYEKEKIKNKKDIDEESENEEDSEDDLFELIDSMYESKEDE